MSKVVCSFCDQEKKIVGWVMLRKACADCYRIHGEEYQDEEDE